MSIQVGELALASLGINSLIADTLPKVGKQRLEDFAAVEKKIPRLASDLVDGRLEFTAMDRPHSYEKLLKVLGGLPKSVDVQAWINKFDLENLSIASSFAIAAQTALNDLATVFPRQSYVTLSGPQDLLPPTPQQWQFFSVLDVVNDPLRVFSLMSRGGLLPRQRDAVKLVFPGISANIDQALVDELINAKSRKASFQLSKLVEFGVSTWQNKRVLEYRPPQQVPTAQGPKVDGKGSKRSGKGAALDKATQTQKIDAGV